MVVVPPYTDQFISWLFLVEKKDKSLFRPEINVKPLNTFTQKEHFKTEGARTYCNQGTGYTLWISRMPTLQFQSPKSTASIFVSCGVAEFSNSHASCLAFAVPLVFPRNFYSTSSDGLLVPSGLQTIIYPWWYIRSRQQYAKKWNGYAAYWKYWDSQSTITCHRPFQLSRSNPWTQTSYVDVQTVLGDIAQLGDNESLSLKHLSLKLVTFMSLASANRVSP